MTEKNEKWHFKKEISISHLFTLLAFVVAGFAAWNNLDKRVLVLETQSNVLFKRIERRLENIENKLDRKADK